MTEPHPLHDLAAECIVLGAIMQAPDVADAVADVIRSADDFAHPAHRVLYAQIVANLAVGEPVDPVALAHSLDVHQPKWTQTAGGRPYLVRLIESVPTVANAAWYARLVADFAARRRIIAAAETARNLAYEVDWDVHDVANLAQQTILDATAPKRPQEVRRLDQLVDEELPELLAEDDEVGGKRGLSTGLGSLDDVIGGLKPGQLVLVAGRPGAGKSVLLTDFARAAVRRGEPTLLVSLEMHRREVLARIYAAEAGVYLNRLLNGGLSLEDRARISAATERLRPRPMHIDTSRNADLGSIRSTARRLKARHGLSLLVVDYLQLMGSPVRRESRVLELGEISRGLKLLAGDLDIPVVAAAQLNRQSETRADKRPQLSDLRESGSLEQDSDIVILIHRPDLFEPESPRAGEVDLIVAKNRNGPTDTVTAAAQLAYARFVDMAVT